MLWNIYIDNERETFEGVPLEYAVELAARVRDAVHPHRAVYIKSEDGKIVVEVIRGA